MNATDQQNWQSPDSIDHDTESRRERLEARLRELESRFAPGQFTDQVVAPIRDNGADLIDGIGRMARNNPMPTALIGAGLVWLAVGSRSNGGGAISHRIGEFAADAQDGLQRRAERARSTIRDGVEHARDAIQDQAGETRNSMRESAAHMRRTGRGRIDDARRASGETASMLRERPLVAGAIGSAVGALLGSLIPVSTQEREIAGAVQDHYTRNEP